MNIKRILSRKVLMLFLCAALFFTCSVPAFASEGNVDVSNVLKELNANTSLSSTSDLIDGQPINETIHGVKVFNINVADLDYRRIMTVSNVPLKVIITSSTFPTSVVNYDSGYFRIGNKASINFVPGVDYQLIVVTQDGVDAQVNLAMDKTFDTSWVTYSTYDLEQDNILLGGKTEVYDVAFTNPGKYKITVTSNIDNLVATVKTPAGNESVLLNTSSHSFIVNGQATGNMQDYSVIVTNLHPNNGGPYSVKIERIN